MALRRRQASQWLSLLVCSVLGRAELRPQQQPRVSVLVMRHCFRAMDEDGIDDIAGLPYFNNYSAEPWAPFDVQNENCLPRGVKLAKAVGAWYQRHADLPRPVRVVADGAVDRTKDTGKAWTEGFFGEVSNETFSIDSAPFSHATSAACRLPTAQEAAAAIAERLAARPIPPALAPLRQRLFAVAGRGAAGNWTEVPSCTTSAKGKLTGNCVAAHEMAERLLMQWAGGMPVGWGRVNVEEIPQLLQLHEFFRGSVHSLPQLLRTTQSSIFHAVLSALAGGTDGTTVFTGHDTQLNALNGALDLTWRPNPYPENATLPNSAIHFRRVGDEVTVEYLFIDDISSDDGDVRAVPAVGPSTESTLSFAQLAEALAAAGDPACSNPFGSARPTAATKQVSGIIV